MENTIKVTAWHFYSDWTETRDYSINLDEIIGFAFHWRLQDWHVEVVTKQKLGEYTFYTYELSHWVSISECQKLLQNPKVKVLRFMNTHNHDSFTEALNKLLTLKPKSNGN